MAAISINDSLLLCFALHYWLVGAVNIHKWYLWECKINAYLHNFSLQCATYQVLAMTFDKFVAIKWPHRSAIYSTSKRARVIISTIFISTAMYNTPHFLLIHMNYVIVKTVRNSRRMFRSDTGSVGTERRQKSMKSAENQLTTMLLLVTTLFLILLLPHHIRFIYAAFYISNTPSKFATSLFLFEISYKLYLTNSGINFFLYCVSGQKFRNDLKEISCCIGRFSIFSTAPDPNVTNISTI